MTTTSHIVRAKLHRPEVTAGLIIRRRLLAHLEEGLNGKVTLVSAAAGTGKTTLLSTWLAHLHGTYAETTATAWLSLDEGDDQVGRFVQYLAAAIDVALPHSCNALLSFLQESTLPPVEVMADFLADGVGQALTAAPDAKRPSRLVVVLDDLYSIDNAQVYALLARLVQHAPAGLHLVLSTRIDPPLPLNRWRAQGQMQEVRRADLAFTAAETEAFLAQLLPQPPGPDVAAALHSYTEGWGVGLRLAGLALRGHADSRQFLAGLAAHGERYMLNYLSEDVLEQQAPAVQEFLLGISVLNRFCAPLCAATLAIDEQTAQQQLEYVERANLFLVDLSTPRFWYRYHHVFQSMLRAKLQQRNGLQQVHMLQRRAAAWLEAQGEVGDAMGYLLAAGAHTEAAELLERRRMDLINEQLWPELRDALSALPQEIVQARPLLLMSKAWVQRWQYDRAGCAATTLLAHDLLASDDCCLPPPQRAVVALEISALAAPHGPDVSDASIVATIRQRWQEAQPHIALIHNTLVTTLAERCQSCGEVETGLKIISSALARPTNWSPAAACRILAVRGLVEFWDCRLDRAQFDLQAGLYLADQAGIASMAAFSQALLGVIASLRRQDALAETFWEPVLDDLYLDDGRYAILSLLYMITQYWRSSRVASTRPYIERLQAHAAKRGLHMAQVQFDALTAFAAAANDDMPRALAWALTDEGMAAQTMLGAADRRPWLRARVLVAEGSPASLRQACRILEDLCLYQAGRHQRHYVAEAQALLAAARFGLGHLEAALDALGQSVAQAVPNGIVGWFVDLGEPMRQMLLALRRRPAQREAAELLLAAWGNTTGGGPGGGQGQEVALADALTQREIDVLRLMAQGLANKQIAQRLILSANTVRNHSARIYEKLQVQNRSQAVNRAHALGLVDLSAHRFGDTN